MLPRVRMIVADMAGTVVQENGIVYETLYERPRHFHADVQRGSMPSWHGRSKHEVLSHFLFTSDPADWTDDFERRLLRNYEVHPISLIHPRVPDVFATLRDRGILITLNTGYSKTIQDCIVDRLGLDAMVDGRISSSEVDRSRPYPDMVLKLANQFGVESNEVLKVGDTANDILEGRNADCFATVGVRSGAESNFPLADIVLDTIVDLEHHYVLL